MQCRHTVPDWHRYVNPPGDAVAIFAGCRLLVKEGGEPAGDPRSIACAYWGHQKDCPLYEGPGAVASTPRDAPARLSSPDVPVAVEMIWPVRGPGAKDAMRLVTIALGVLSIILLGWIALLGLSVLSGQENPSAYVHATLAVATVSLLTHVLGTLRAWARR